MKERSKKREEKEEGEESTYIPYEKMANSTSEWGEIPNLKKTKFVVLEKVHGANMAFIYREGKVLCAKRRQILKENEKFFGYQKIREKLEPKIEKLGKSVIKDFNSKRKGESGEEEVEVIVFGELFGGKYKTEKEGQVYGEGLEEGGVEGVQVVQEEILYSPQLNFIAFDVCVEFKEKKVGREKKKEKGSKIEKKEGEENNICNEDKEKEEKRREYLSYKKAMEHLKESEILFCVPLALTSIEKAVNWNLQFETTIPKQLGLHSIGKENIAEGIVVKPFEKDLVYSNKKGKEERVILKIKNQKFEEKVKEFGTKSKKGQSKKERVLQQMTLYFNKNR